MAAFLCVNGGYNMEEKYYDVYEDYDLTKTLKLTNEQFKSVAKSFVLDKRTNQLTLFTSPRALTLTTSNGKPNPEVDFDYRKKIYFNYMSFTQSFLNSSTASDRFKGLLRAGFIPLIMEPYPLAKCYTNNIEVLDEKQIPYYIVKPVQVLNVNYSLPDEVFDVFVSRIDLAEILHKQPAEITVPMAWEALGLC